MFNGFRSSTLPKREHLVVVSTRRWRCCMLMLSMQAAHNRWSRSSLGQAKVKLQVNWCSALSLKLEVLARAERYISAVAAPIPKWARSGISAYSFQVPLAIMSVKLKEAKLHFGQVTVIDFQTCERRNNGPRNTPPGWPLDVVKRPESYNFQSAASQSR